MRDGNGARACSRQVVGEAVDDGMAPLPELLGVARITTWGSGQFGRLGRPAQSSSAQELQLQAFAKLLIDANRLLMQHPRLTQIAGEQPRGGERAQAARQGLGGANGADQGMRLAQ